MIRLTIILLLFSFGVSAQDFPQKVVGKQRFTDSLQFSRYKNNGLGDSVLSTNTEGKVVMKKIVGTGAAVDTVYRVDGVDSIYYIVGGITYSLKDSTGGGGGSPNTSIGSAYKIAVNGTNDIKSLYGNWGAILDSATSGQVGILVDTSSGKVATQTMLATKWDKSGNAGTTAGTDFIGTTDAQDLVFKTGGTEYSRLNTSGRYGINKSTGIIGKLHIKTDDIQATQTDSTGIYLENSTAATSGVTKQFSPGITFKGEAWKSGGGATNHPHLWRIDVQPLNGAFTSSTFQFNVNANNAGYAAPLTISSGGAMQLNSVSSGVATTGGGTINGLTITGQGPSGSVQIGGGSTSNVNGVAIGFSALASTAGGANYNTAVGNFALGFTTTGQSNSAVGHSALYHNTTGTGNTAVGVNAALNNISGQKNSLLGSGVSENDTSGSFNSGVGQDWRYQATSGNYNSGIGYEGMNNMTTGFGNNGLGYRSAGRVTTGSYNDFIGYGSGSTSASQKVDAVASVAIGKDSYTTEDSTIVLGADFIKKTYLKGAVIAAYLPTGVGTKAVRIDGSGNLSIADTTTGGGSMVYPGAGIALSNGSGWSTSITDNSANWNTAYSQTRQWDGGATGLVAATGRTSLGLVIGTDVQAYDPDLTTYAGITPSADIQTFLGAGTYSDMRTQLSLVPGTNVQAYNANLTTWAGIAPGTGVGTALGLNIGSAGAPILFNGALGTPSSGTLTSATGLPLTTGLTGGNWKTIYTNGSGAVVELPLGSAGKVLTTNGASSAPTWETPAGGSGLTFAQVSALMVIRY